jgi:HD superfamily phosphohydrolase
MSKRETQYSTKVEVPAIIEERKDAPDIFDNLNDKSVCDSERTMDGGSRNGEPNSNAKSKGQKGKSTKSDRQEFYLPVTGFAWFYPEEVSIINHPAFQRLRRIYQLGQTHYVYPGATHKRFEHVLGTVHLAQRMIEAIAHNSKKGALNSGEVLNESEERFIRLGALLHDIGHMAAGHTIEDELCLIGKHDEPERLEYVFHHLKNPKGKDLSQLINELFAAYVPDDIAIYPPSDIVKLLITKSKTPTESENDIRKTTSLRLNICKDIIGNTICADILDYIHRDWYHIGKSRPFDERLLQYMEIRKGGVSGRSQDDKFVISLGKSPKIRTDAISDILGLLEWRYQLAESVLFHRTKLSFAAMLDRALHLVWGDCLNVQEKIYPLSDDELLTVAFEEAAKLPENRREIAKQLLDSLRNRYVYTSLVTFSYDELTPDLRDGAELFYGKSKDRTRNLAPTNRNEVLSLLEKDFSLSPGSLAMYCPTAKMNAKVAEVQIALGNRIQKFCDFEEDNATGLAGGHLSAQINRFHRLWRIQFVIERSEADRLKQNGIFTLLSEFIEKVVIGATKAGQDPLVCAYHTVKLLKELDPENWQGDVKKLEDISSGQLAAYKEQPTGCYMTGVPSLKQFSA